jgi:hypothetical protein
MRDVQESLQGGTEVGGQRQSAYLNSRSASERAASACRILIRSNGSAQRKAALHDSGSAVQCVAMVLGVGAEGQTGQSSTSYGR